MNVTTNSRSDTLAHGDAAWSRLRDKLDSHLNDPLSAQTDWTGRDVYAHFARWQALSIEAARALIAGQRPPTATEDENVLNDRWRIEDQDLPADVARERCLDTRRELRDLLSQATDEQWLLWGSQVAADVSGEQYAHHLASIVGPTS